LREKTYTILQKIKTKIKTCFLKVKVGYIKLTKNNKTWLCLSVPKRPTNEIINRKNPQNMMPPIMLVVTILIE
jgi:hypothetical protein